MIKDYVYKGILKWIGNGFIVESSAGHGVHLVSNSDAKFLKYLSKDRNSVFEVAYYMETYGPFNYAHIIIPDNLFERVCTKDI